LELGHYKSECTEIRVGKKYDVGALSIMLGRWRHAAAAAADGSLEQVTLLLAAVLPSNRTSPLQIQQRKHEVWAIFPVPFLPHVPQGKYRSPHGAVRDCGPLLKVTPLASQVGIEAVFNTMVRPCRGLPDKPSSHESLIVNNRKQKKMY
jgi:hypothetical protein